MAGLKNSKPNGILDIKALNNRVFASIDNEVDFFSRALQIHGYLFKNPATATSYDSGSFYTGPINQLVIQQAGSGTITVTASIDNVTFVAANTISSSDGLLRFSGLYRYFKITAANIDGSSSAYIALF